jgi:hypothetical protein
MSRRILRLRRRSIARWPLAALLAGLLCLALAPGVRAQDADSAASLSADELADMGEAAKPVQELRPLKSKTVVLIFDVSGSMNSNHMLKRARQAAANIVRYAVRPGDEVDLFTFGSGYHTKRQKIESGDDKSAVLQAIPTATGEGEGTNIRHPHHEALKLLEPEMLRPAAIIILTDSYNDEPKPEDPTYPDYLRYYTPGGMLTKYPKTPENRDYERLLRELVVSGKVKQYGIGINIAEDGRPIERLPQAAPPPVEAPAATPAPAPPAPKPAESSFPYVWVGLGALVLIGGTVLLLQSTKPTALRITGGPGGVKDFQVKNGQPVRLGGDGANFAPDAYPLPGIAQPIALIKASRGIMTLMPPATKGSAGAGSNEKGGARVYHNGVPLDSEAPLHFGDEVRITAPTDTGATREYRLKFDDPRKGY